METKKKSIFVGNSVFDQKLLMIRFDNNNRYYSIDYNRYCQNHPLRTNENHYQFSFLFFSFKLLSTGNDNDHHHHGKCVRKSLIDDIKQQQQQQQHFY